MKKVSLLKVNCDVILVAEDDDGTLIELPARQAVLSSRDLHLLSSVVEGELERINNELVNVPAASPIAEAPAASSVEE